MHRHRNWLPIFLTAAIITGCASTPSHPIYRGAVVNGVPNGKGVKYFPDGSKYEGDWANGLYDGQGVLTAADKVGRYEGGFSAGQRSGQGRQVYSDGSIYEGSWSNGMRNGQGKFTAMDGTYLEGNWKDDKANGQATAFNPNYNSKYTGNWQDGMYHGLGVHQLRNSNYYKGSFSSGKRNGDGAAVAFYYPDSKTWCLDNCAQDSLQFALVAGSFRDDNADQVTVTPCGSSREKCRAMVEPALAAIASDRAKRLAAAEAEKKRLAAEAEAEKKRKEAAILAEQKRKEAERQALLNQGTAAQVYTYADELESAKDYSQASEVYRIVVKRFPDSPFAASAMGRLGAIRDKRDQMEAEQRRMAHEEELRKADDLRRQQEAEQRQAERNADAAQRDADRQSAAAQQQKSATGAACVEAAKALCDQQFSGLANIACKAAAGAGCN